MKRVFITTGDGSKTIHLPEWNEHYHSKHGAIQEALHVFIREGLHHFRRTYPDENVRLLEIGFGTGLNALLTWSESKREETLIHYHGIEAYPISQQDLKYLNYPGLIDAPITVFRHMHEVPWETDATIDDHFILRKSKMRFEDIDYDSAFNLIYFDAFGARVQPELWTEAIFHKMFQALTSPGILVTYAAKGSVRRALQAVGFKIERLPGPPGKREMLRATKFDK